MLFTTARSGPDRTRRDIAGIRRVPSQVSVDVITRPSCCCCFGRIQIDMQISGERRQISSPADRAIAASTCGESAVIAAGTRRARLCGPADWAEIRGRVAVSMSDGDSVPSTVVSEARLTHYRHDEAVLCDHPITPELLVSMLQPAVCLPFHHPHAIYHWR